MMDEKKRSWLNGLMRTLTRFDLAAIMAILMYLRIDVSETRFMAILCLLWIPAVVTVLLEMLVESTALLVLCELACLALLIVPGQTGGIGSETIGLLAGLLVILVPSLVSAGAGRQNLLDHPIAGEGALFLLAYVLTDWFDAGFGYRCLVYFLAVLFLVLYFFWKNQYGLQEYMRLRGGRSKALREQMENEVLPVNRRSLLPFFLILILVSVLVWIPMGSQAIADALNEQYSEVVDDITEWFEEEMTGISEMGGGAGQDEGEGEPEEEETYNETMTIVRRGVGKDYPFLQWILLAFMWGMVIFLVCLLLAMLRRLSAKTRKRSRNEMQQEFEVHISEQSSRITKNKALSLEGAGSVSAENKKIRRIYRDEVRRGLQRTEEQASGERAEKDYREERRRRQALQAMTPTELEHSAGMREGEQPENSAEAADSRAERSAAANVDLLHALYEKARYGREGCTRDEVKLAEQAVKNS